MNKTTQALVDAFFGKPKPMFDPERKPKLNDRPRIVGTLSARFA